MQFNFRGITYTVKNDDRIEYSEEGNMQTTVIDNEGNEFEMIFDSESSPDVELTDSDIIDVIQYE